MKIFIRLLTVFAVITTASTAMASRVFILKPQYAFTPKGFDANDNAEVVLAGAFSDYCMQVGATHHKVDVANKKIYIDSTYTSMNDCNDIEMYIPYSVEVSLGALPQGNYDVMVLDADNKYTLMSTLPIGAAKTRQTDDRLYAPVTSIEFKSAENFGTPQVTIKGVLTNSCLTLGNVEVYARAGDVFEVLPLVSASKTNCMATVQPFEKTVVLNGFSTRNTLIHVRSMNGQALNKVVTSLDRLKWDIPGAHH